MSYEAILKKVQADRGGLLDALKAVQAEDGFLTDAGMRAVASAYGFYPSQIYETATFYGMLHVRKQAKHTVAICESTCCHAEKGNALCAEVQQKFGNDGQITIRRCECLGHCNTAPNALVDGTLIKNATVEKISAELRKAGM